MARRRNLLRAIRRKLAKSSCRAIDVDKSSCEQEGEAHALPDDRSALIGENSGRGGAGARPRDSGSSTDGALVAAPEDVAAVKIQAAYRGHLRGVPVAGEEGVPCAEGAGEAAGGGEGVLRAAAGEGGHAVHAGAGPVAGQSPHQAAPRQGAGGCTDDHLLRVEEEADIKFRQLAAVIRLLLLIPEAWEW